MSNVLIVSYVCRSTRSSIAGTLYERNLRDTYRLFQTDPGQTVVSTVMAPPVARNTVASSVESTVHTHPNKETLGL